MILEKMCIDSQNLVFISCLEKFPKVLKVILVVSSIKGSNFRPMGIGYVTSSKDSLKSKCNKIPDP